MVVLRVTEPGLLSWWYSGLQIDEEPTVPPWSFGSVAQIITSPRTLQVCPGYVLLPQLWGEEGKKALAYIARLLCNAKCLWNGCQESGSAGGGKCHTSGPPQSLQRHREQEGNPQQPLC